MTSGKIPVGRAKGSLSFPFLSLFSSPDHREGADAVCKHLIKELPRLLHKGENGEGQALGP